MSWVVFGRTFVFVRFCLILVRIALVFIHLALLSFAQ